jgi:hypothetical protein
MKDTEILKLTINEMKGLFYISRLPYWSRCTSDFTMNDMTSVSRRILTSCAISSTISK